MSKNLYTKLAVDGLKNNAKLYVPYIISIGGVAAIYYILTYLSISEIFKSMGGGWYVQIIMMLGKFVMVFFSLLFLFYTNSFLAKKRNKEFALYNILGMNKKNIVKILAREALIEGSIAIVGGILLGMLFSKFFELLTLKLCDYSGEVMSFFSWRPVIETAIFFGAITFVLFLFSVFKVAINKPIELLRSEKAGEKEPKANFVIGILGVILLGAAYFISLSIKDPVEGLLMFFAAVFMVIGATYMLFVAGSVCICKILKKKKSYYYKPNHFVSLSGMIYRMKRNGAGLASICILSTMILVMIASAGSLYIGRENTANNLNPRDILMTFDVPREDAFNEDKYAEIRNEVEKVVKEHGVEMKNVTDFTQLMAICDSDGRNVKLLTQEERENGDYGSLISVAVFFDADEYKKYDSSIDLKPGEALIEAVNAKVKNELIIDGESIKKVGTPDAKQTGIYSNAIKLYNIVTPDFDKFMEKCEEKGMLESTAFIDYRFAFDTDLSKEEQIALSDDLWKVAVNYGGKVNCKAEDTRDFMELYGGLLVLGIFLSISFMLACALIMYYKQITEGYEDSHSYSIMRKVGMTKEEIKAGIKSQTLITFFSPLFAAGIHLLFSFPLVREVLKLFSVVDTTMLSMIYLSFYLLFALFYYFVYKKTVKVYLDIVSY